jgi:hypothetical protein
LKLRRASTWAGSAALVMDDMLVMVMEMDDKVK